MTCSVRLRPGVGEGLIQILIEIFMLFLRSFQVNRRGGLLASVMLLSNRVWKEYSDMSLLTTAIRRSRIGAVYLSPFEPGV